MHHKGGVDAQSRYYVGGNELVGTMSREPALVPVVKAAVF